jgi:hypothetical protein
MIRIAQRVGYPSAGLAIVVMAGLLGFTGHGLNALAVRTLNGKAWLVNTVYRSVSLIDGYSGKVAAQVGVPGMGERPVVINSPSGAIVTGADGHMVKVSDANFTTGTSVQLFGSTGSTSAESGGQNALYAIDQTTGQIQRLDDSGPKLVPIGPVISAKAPIASPIVAPDGSLYVAVPGAGTIEHLVRDRLVTIARFGRPGDQLRLLLAGTVPVAADLTAGTLVRLGAAGIVGSVVHVPSGFEGVRAAGSDTVSGLVGLVGSRSVVSVNLLNATVTNTPLPYQVAAAATVMRARSVVFIDSTRHDVLIVNTVTNTVRPPLTMPGHQVPDQLTVQDRLVFVNASGSSSALVINGTQVRRVTKYTGPPPVQHHKPKQTPTPTPISTPTPQPTSGSSPTPVETPVPVKPSGPSHTPGSPKPGPSAPPKRPGPPRNVTATPGNGQVTLGWNPAAPNGSALTQYTISWTAGTGGQPGSTRAMGTSQGTVVPNLSNGASYTFTVTAVNAIGNGPAVRTGPVTPSSKVPGTPLDVAATTPKPDGSVTLTWTAPDNGYAISSYSVFPAGSRTALLTGVKGNTAVVSSTDLTVGTPVQFQVTAISASGTTSALSAPSALVTPYLPPAAPTVMVASVAQDGTSATLSVSCPAACQEGRPPASYQVTVGPSGTPKTVTAQPSGATVTVPLAGLTANTNYTVSVTATDTAGAAGTQPALVSVTTLGPPPTVTSVTVTAAGGYTKTLEVSATVNSDELSSTTCTVAISGLPTVTGSCSGPISVAVPTYNTNYTATFTATNSDGNSQGTATGNSGLDQLTADATTAFGPCPGSGKYCGGNSHLEPNPNFGSSSAPLVNQGSLEQVDCWTTGGPDHGNVNPYTATTNQWVHVSTPAAGYMSILWFPNPYSVTAGLPPC